MTMDIILASNSPRRKQLLGEIFDNFAVLPQNVEEKCDLKRGYAVCRYLAAIKLATLPAQYPHSLIISADTVVCKSGKIYGKPKDQAEAKLFLGELSGQRHTVYTGVAIYYNGKKHIFYDKSTVKLKKLSEKEKLDYIENFAPFDKAGGYGIQDSEVVESYDGSYSNIVGLPIEKLREELTKII